MRNITTKNTLRVAGLCLLLLAVAVQGQVTSVDAIGMTVSDMERAVAFYSNVLNFKKVSDIERSGEALERLDGVFGARQRIVRMQLGDEFIELVEFIAPKGRPIPVDSRSNDRWFQHIAIIVSDMSRAYELLRKHNVEHASTSPQRIPDWNKAAAGIWAFYFKDPDGHPLEILSFPPDKGVARWHDTTRIFLGIDHTAIVVDDTETSLAFYRDILGFTVAGESENFGTEQEHLNNVFGARLYITSLRAASGPAVEFLEYLAPRDGRPYPDDARSNDLVHRSIIMSTSRIDSAFVKLRSAKARLVSPGVVSLTDTLLGYRQALEARDPDGHVIRLTQR